jgi:hypothetical protein
MVRRTSRSRGRNSNATRIRRTAETANTSSTLGKVNIRSATTHSTGATRLSNAQHATQKDPDCDEHIMERHGAGAPGARNQVVEEIPRTETKTGPGKTTDHLHPDQVPEIARDQPQQGQKRNHAAGRHQDQAVAEHIADSPPGIQHQELHQYGRPGICHELDIVVLQVPQHVDSEKRRGNADRCLHADEIQREPQGQACRYLVKDFGASKSPNRQKARHRNPAFQVMQEPLLRKIPGLPPDGLHPGYRLPRSGYSHSWRISAISRSCASSDIWRTLAMVASSWCLSVSTTHTAMVARCHLS